MQLNFCGPSAYGILAFAESESAPPSFLWPANLDERRDIEAALWAGHSELVGAFGRWLAGLEKPPATTVLLGSAVRLNEKTARGAAQVLREMFGLAEPQHGSRPLCRIERNGRVRTFTSITAAAEASGVSRARITRCLGALAMRDRGLWLS